MSVTITRTALTDDDGSGTTGTIINNAVKTELYGQIDGALAQVIPFANGKNTDTVGGTQNNYAISTGELYLEWSPVSNVTLTGLTGGSTGRMLYIKNNSTFSIFLKHNDSGSTAGNRIACPSSLGQYVGSLGSVWLFYDGTFWRVFMVEPGAGVAFTPTVVSAGGGTPTYTTQVGYFLQREFHCHYQGRVTLASKGTLAAGQVEIALPFAANSISNSYAGISVGLWGGMTTSIVNIVGYVAPSLAVALLNYTASAGAAPVGMTVADISATFDLLFSVDYIIAG